MKKKPHLINPKALLAGVPLMIVLIIGIMLPVTAQAGQAGNAIVSQINADQAVRADLRFKVGEEVDETFETASPYESSGLVVEKMFHWPEAGYIRIHFAEFDLGPGDYVEISSPDGKYAYRYRGKGKVVRGGTAVLSTFWASHIPGDTTILKLFSTNSQAGRGFKIDRWARGYEPDVIQELFDIEQKSGIEAICGKDDKLWAPCLYGHPQGAPLYEKARTVVRLMIEGTSACTGWLLGSEGHLMTNNHCISSQSAADNTDYEFMAEGASCFTNCSWWGACPGIIEASSGTLEKTDYSLDYTLILLPTNLTATYGYLQFRDTLPTVGETIYIPQHPGAWGKQIAILSDQTQYCEVSSTNQPPCMGGPGDIGYMCDTSGGSSGSPVLGLSDHLVVALHHCANCPNRGVPIPNIIAHMGSDLPDDAIGGDSPDVSVSLTPGPTSIPRGGTLSYQVTVTNNSNSTKTFDYWSDVTLPNGSEYTSSGELFGPVTVTLGPGGSRSADISHYIPISVPLGVYSYNAFVGPYPLVWNEDHFDFNVTP